MLIAFGIVCGLIYWFWVCGLVVVFGLLGLRGFDLILVVLIGGWLRGFLLRDVVLLTVC